jgi:hypothetical protein
MKNIGRHQIWMVLAISCLLSILTCESYGASLTIGNRMLKSISSYNEHGRPSSMPIRKATGRYKETKFYQVGERVGVAHSTGWIPRTA